MTPRQVDELTDEEYSAFVRHMRTEARELAKAAARQRGARR